MSLKCCALVRNECVRIHVLGHGCKNFRKAVVRLGKVHGELKKLGISSQRALKDCLFNCGGSEENWWKLAEQKWKHYCGDHSLCNSNLHCKSHHIKDPEAQVAYIVSNYSSFLIILELMEGMGQKYQQIQDVLQYQSSRDASLEEDTVCSQELQFCQNISIKS